MEPRPQRPRAQSGQPAQGVPQSPQQTEAFAPGEYPEGMDPAAFVAPPRTEYDYSPLDLAPSGQRRRRQLVAAAAGVMGLALLGALIFFTYLLLRDENPQDNDNDVLLAQTEIAHQSATLAAQQTMVANAAAEQTAAAGESGSQETPSGATEESETPADQETATVAETPATEETPAAGETPPAPDLSGNASLPAEELNALLPDISMVPETLTEVTDSSRTLEQVIEALGGGRPAESNLTEWGWSGNVERQFNPVDPEAADPATTSQLTVSIHGFGGPESATQAMPFFADILANLGYDEAEAPQLGDGSRMLTTTEEDGTTLVALYVQDGSVLYRFGGASTTGDPTQDVINLATETLAND